MKDKNNIQKNRQAYGVKHCFGEAPRGETNKNKNNQKGYACGSKSTPAELAAVFKLLARATGHKK